MISLISLVDLGKSILKEGKCSAYIIPTRTTVGDIASWALGRLRCKNGLFLMTVAEGKSAATPLNSLNPNKAQLDL